MPPRRLAYAGVLPEIVEAHVRRIDVALIIHGDTRRRRAGVGHLAQIAGIGNHVLQLAGDRVANHDGPVVGTGCRPESGLARSDALVRGTDVDVVMAVDIHRAWLTELLPRGDEVAVLTEHLHAIVLAIGHIHVPFRTADIELVGFPEVARLRSHASPGFDELPVFREFHD